MIDPEYDIRDERYNHSLVIAHVDVLLSSDTPRLVRQGVRGFNILRWRGHFFGVDQALGSVDLRRLSPSTLPTLAQEGRCVIGGSIAELEGYLDSERFSETFTPSAMHRVPQERQERVRDDLFAAVACYIDQSETVRCLRYLIRGFDDEGIRELVLALKDVTSYEGFIEALTRIQCQQVRSRLDPDRKTIAIYYPSCAYREQTGRLADELAKLKFNVVTLIGTVCNDRYEERRDVYYGGHNIISRMDFLDVILCSTLTYGLPESACKVLFVHDIHDSPIGDAQEFVGLLGEFDYCFLPSDAVIQLFRRLIQSVAPTGGRSQQVCLIPGGYPKLDRLIRYCETQPEPGQTLVYAPTVTGLEFADVTSVAEHGDGIIRQLLAHFPNHEVVFRPHPHSREDEAVRRIRETYQSHPRFMYDGEASDTRQTYARAALMVSDLSGTAYTYALSTLRPVVFYSAREDEVERRYGDLRYVQDRTRVGAVVRNVDDLVEAVEGLMRHPGEWSERIREYRKSLIYNLGSSERYFVESIENICGHRRRPEWVYP
jgi:hypothetical protein